jgi:hypothetical protein
LKLLFKLLNSKTKKVLNEQLLNILAKTFLIGTLIHLFSDLLVSNIMLIYPITTRPFTIFKYFLEPSLIGGFFFSAAFALEIVIIMVFVKMVLNKYFEKEQILKVLNNAGLIFSIMYFVFTFGISRLTYNSSYMYDLNGDINYDIDFDTLKDSQDMDVDNDGIDNFNDVEKSEVSKTARNIVESNKLAEGGSKSFVRDIKHAFGALNSYDLILQTYFDLHSPIGPVLKDHYKTGSYSFIYSNADFLYGYLEDSDYLLELNTEAKTLLPEGNIFFITTEDGDILNLGITLDNNQLGIVLDTDTKLQLHTYEEILSKYPEMKIYIQNN